MKGIASAAVLFAVAAGSWAWAQTRRPPSFGSGVEMIKLNVSVTDGRNGYVTNLQNGDFAVYEDGIPQDVTLFAQEEVPVSLVLMIDCSASMNEKLAPAQEAALRFTGILGPRDEAQVVQFNERAAVLEPFTSDLDRVRAAIRRIELSGSTALHSALYVATKELMSGRDQSQVRRRAIVLLTDGEDTQSAVGEDQLLRLVRKSNVIIYTISIRPEESRTSAREGQLRAEYLLNALARETGGRAYFPARLGEIDSVYGQIARELRTLYTLGYASSTHEVSRPRQESAWRRILVRITSRGGLTVRHRPGYDPNPG